MTCRRPWSFLETTVTALVERSAEVMLPGEQKVRIPCDVAGLKTGVTVTLGARPEHLSESGGGDGQIHAEVFVVEQLGRETYVYLPTDSGRSLVVNTDGASDVKAGDRMSVGIKAESSHLFDASGVAICAH